MVHLIIQTKADLKIVTCINTSNLALKSVLGILKSERDELDIFPADFSKQSTAVNNNVKKLCLIN